MPQKKNPDVAELGRGKTGRVYGHLMGMLTTMKGLPLSYNRDLQEDKEGLFDTVDTLLPTLAVFTGMVKTLKVKADRTDQAAGQGYILATDVADYLVKKGLPFRRAHEAVAKLVSYAVEKGKELHQLELGEYRQFSPLFDAGVLDVSVTSSIKARSAVGGTAPEQVDAQLARARGLVKSGGGGY
jgi:argininosuccinate lyase